MIVYNDMHKFSNAKEFLPMLTCIGHFPLFSFNHIFRIYQTNPQATQLKTFAQWNNLGYSIKPQSKAIILYYPKFEKKVFIDPKTEYLSIKAIKIGYEKVFLFDIQQTNGPKINANKKSEEEAFALMKLIYPYPIKEINLSSTISYRDTQSNIIYLHIALDQKRKLKELIKQIISYYGDSSTSSFINCVLYCLCIYFDLDKRIYPTHLSSQDIKIKEVHKTFQKMIRIIKSTA